MCTLITETVSVTTSAEPIASTSGVKSSSAKKVNVPESQYPSSKSILDSLPKIPQIDKSKLGIDGLPKVPLINK